MYAWYYHCAFKYSIIKAMFTDTVCILLSSCSISWEIFKKVRLPAGLLEQLSSNNRIEAYILGEMLFIRY